jgi:CMP-N-acetylneuraminic acid synthetase/SAM-dependent methyltransferase
MKNIAIIPARSGSKRIRHKNIKLIAGYPLLYYAIRCARNVSEIDKVVVTTDSEIYKKIAESYGASVVIRPVGIANDDSKSEDSVLHALDVMASQGKNFDNIILMQSTNPFVEPRDIESGLEMIEKDNSSSLVTYTDFNGFFIEDKDLFERPMTQKKKSRKLESGAFWITKVKDFRLSKNRICEPVSYMKLNWLSSIDIDTQQDLEMAECILEKKMRIEHQSYYKKRPYTGNYESYYISNKDPDGVIRNLTEENEMKHRAELAKDEIKYINNLIGDGISRKILDLGCGTGAISSCFESSYEKYGLEIEESITGLTRKNFDKDRLHKGVLSNDTYSDEFFDVVFSFHVIEHVSEPIEFIGNVSRILKTHGKLVISTPNFDSAAARRFGDNFRMLHDKTHCSLFSDRGLSDLLHDHGFQVDHIDYPFFDTEYFTIDNLSKLFDVTKMSPAFYGNIMTIYATKK